MARVFIAENYITGEWRWGCLLPSNLREVVLKRKKALSHGPSGNIPPLLYCWGTCVFVSVGGKRSDIPTEEARTQQQQQRWDNK